MQTADRLLPMRLADLRVEAEAFAGPRRQRIRAACEEIETAISELEAAGLSVRRRYPLGVAETMTTGFRVEIEMAVRL